MSRLNLALFIALILSSLYLVKQSSEGRRLFVAVERAQAEERTLETEYARLQVEKRAEATPLRIERLAREKLEMRSATPGVTLYVNHQAGTTAGVEPVDLPVGADMAVPADAGVVPQPEGAGQ